ncbi:MAG: NAD(P)-binding protein [Acidobacteriota bacterium]
MSEPGSCSLSRRELLAGLMGLGVVACSPGRPRRGSATLVGSLVDDHRGVGHRLRDGGFGRPESFESAELLILGAGVAGLSAAWACDHAGLRDYRVLELGSTPGGTSSSGKGPVTAYPWGGHYVPVPPVANRPLVTLLDEVGAMEGRDDEGRPLWAEEVLCRAPQERLFQGGAWIEGLFPSVGETEEDREQRELFRQDVRRWAAWRDERGRPAFVIPRALGSDAPIVRELDTLSMAQHLDRVGIRSERVRWWVEYGCRDDYGTSLEQTSAWAGIHYHASRMNADTGEQPEVLTWPEGNGRLVAHMAEGVGDRLALGHAALRIDPGEEGVEVDVLDVARDEMKGYRAQQVIVAAPRFVLSRLLVPWQGQPPSFLSAFEHGSWVVANLTLSDRPFPDGYPECWDNVLFDSPSLGYVSATHQLGSDHGPTVWTYYRPFPTDDPVTTRRQLHDRTWDEWVHEIVADLSQAHPELPELIERVDVRVHGHAMVRPSPGFLFSEALRRASEPLGRVHFAHAELSGLPLFEEAQYWGIHAAEAVLGQRGVGFESWLS